MCKLCGEEDGCSPIGGGPYQWGAHFTPEDWEKIYIHFRWVYLPYMHNIIIKSYERAGYTITKTGRIKKPDKETQP